MIKFTFDTGEYFSGIVSSGKLKGYAAVGMNNLRSVRIPPGHEFFEEATRQTEETIEEFIDKLIEKGVMIIS